MRPVSRAKAAPVKIIVDVHERESGIAETLAELGAEIEIASLPAGDYAVGADTIVERKRILDLHAAVLKGRLWPQLSKLRAACSFPYLVVEGTDIDRGHCTRMRSAGPASPPSIGGLPCFALAPGATRRSGSTVWPSAAKTSS